MLAQRREQQRPIILDPKLAALPHKLVDPALALLEVVRRLQMLGFVPVAVRAALDGLRDRAVILDAKEEVDRSLLVRV